MSKALAVCIEENLTGGNISHSNILCGHGAGFVRECIWQVYGQSSTYSPPTGLDAIAQYDWFKRRGLVVPLKKGAEIGDILIKFGGAHGHCGVRIPGNRVAENGPHHGVGDEDARGIRTLNQFGEFDGIIRLPEPIPA